MTRTVVVGGGAAGIAAALAAAKKGERVLVLERNARPLKKLGVTGNGRCNLLNSGAPVYYGDEAFAKNVLARMPYERLRSFFERIGVPLRQEAEGRVYPAALQAAVVADALLLRARQLGVEIATGRRVSAIAWEKGSFALTVRRLCDDGKARLSKSEAPTETEERMSAARVIVAAGGAAAPAHGTDGGGYALLSAFGHRITPVRPALCALCTDTTHIAGLSGARLRASLRLLDANGATRKQTEGEALLSDDGVSGIAAMQLARFCEAGDTLLMDLRPALCMERATEGELTARLTVLREARADCAVGEWLAGMLPPKLAGAWLRRAVTRELRGPLRALSPDAAQSLAHALCAFPLSVLGTRDFAQAQVTAGGARCDAFDPASMQSRLRPGLFAAGEVLDVDGDCGGFNLMFAFASGLLAGEGQDR